MTSEGVESDPAPHDPDTSASELPAPQPGDRQAALASRLDHLEHVLREEVLRQRERAERAEAQLRALGDLDEHAADLVSEARAEASKVLEAARHTHDRAVAERREADAMLQQAKTAAERLTRDPGAGRPAPNVPGPGALDRELLEALRDHLIDTGALYAQLTAETRGAVIRLIQAASQARGKPELREVPFDEVPYDLEQARR